MPFDTIQKVWSKRDKKPGTVVFQGGQKFSTFSDAILKAADDLVGQLVEYTTEQKGEYTNLAGVKPASRPGNGNQQSASQPSERIGVAVPSEMPALIGAIKTLTDAIIEQAAAYKRVANALLSGAPLATAAIASGAVVQAAIVPAADSVDEMQKTLAKTVGEDAAEAMFSAIRKKHSKSAEKLQAAAVELLKAHNITAEAA